MANVVLLSGGLGNQMFQYAFYLSLKKKNSNSELNSYLISRDNPHNGFELPIVFKLKIRVIWWHSLFVRLFRKVMILNNKLSTFVSSLFSIFSFHLVKEIGNACYNDLYLYPQKGINFFWGYWQTEKYFDEIKEIVRIAFQFDLNALSLESKNLVAKLQGVNGISLHIRRGDYLSIEALSIYGNICTSDYYAEAISLIIAKVKNPHFFIFSDDLDWVKSTMIIPNATYVEWNHGKDSWQDMCLMSKCKHNIIANSSFSWWGAWLNENPDKIVIAPSRFLNNSETPDILPETWIKISV